MAGDSKKRYSITIRNWDRYQPNMRPGKRRHRRREWVAISVDLFSDPDFLDLTITDSLAWVGLLLHAGKVGVPFELSESLARVMFGLKHSPSFERLQNQGFIEIATATRQDSTKENKTKHTVAAKLQHEVAEKPKIKPKKNDVRFDDFWLIWPKRLSKSAAKKAWMSGKCDAIADTIIDNVRFRVQNETAFQDPSMQHVPYPATFLNQRRWEDEMIQTKETGKVDTDEKWARAVSEIEGKANGPAN